VVNQCVRFAPTAVGRLRQVTLIQIGRNHSARR
jgi:hypothetical protein